MAETNRLGLPLLQAAQAQKHVTMNEALARLDALAALELSSRSATTPPAAPGEGAAFAVPEGAGGDWTGAEGRLAIFVNGGWTFADPARGWRGWDAETGERVIHDGTGWVATEIAPSTGGAATRQRIIEFDYVLVPGGVQDSAIVIPARARVDAVTARVIAPLTGAGLTTWRLGVAGSDDRYGSGLGTALNSWAAGRIRRCA
ncbi:MAG: DUF2793 domain-containing protein [Rubricella sp.]